jgi:hypothetical protein
MVQPWKFRHKKETVQIFHNTKAAVYQLSSQPVIKDEYCSVSTINAENKKEKKCRERHQNFRFVLVFECCTEQWISPTLF